MDEILSRIRDHIEEKVPADETRFHEISEEKCNKTMAFVDGGNLEIIKSPSLSVFFNRTYITTYKENKRINCKRNEFYTLITANEKKGKTSFLAETFGDLKIKKEFDLYDRTITSFNHAAEISSIGNIIRRFAELKSTEEAQADFIIIDGSLEEKYTYEKEFLRNIKFGISKTNRELINGNTYTAAVANRKGTWYYDCGKFYFIKLHPKSKYVFKFEAKEDFSELLWLLKENSKDPLFVGYPYGLIEADMFAKVCEEEKKILELRFKTKLGKKVEPFLNSLNAHELF